MNSRREILEKAVHDCYKEMYAKAQPSADWDKIVQEFKDGIRDKDERVYEQHYLSKEEYEYIVDKYIDMYNINSHWKDDINILEEYLSKGGLKDKYIERKIDEDGFTHPGYRSTEKVDPLYNHIKEILKDEYGEDWYEFADEKARRITDKVMELIKECKDFYKFDKEENDFRFSCALGASPTCNPQTVKEYWKNKTGKDIEIIERNPKLFWYDDNEYSDEDIEYEFEKTREQLNKEWAEELEKREQERKEKYENLKRKIEHEQES